MSLTNFNIKIKLSIYDEKSALLLIFILKPVNDTKYPVIL